MSIILFITRCWCHFNYFTLSPPLRGVFFPPFNKFRLLMEERENTVREMRKKDMKVTTIDSVDPLEFSVRLNKKNWKIYLVGTPFLLRHRTNSFGLVTCTVTPVKTVEYRGSDYFLVIIGKCCTFTVYRRWSSPTWSGCQSFLKTKWNLVFYETIKGELKKRLIYDCRCDERRKDQVERSTVHTLMDTRVRFRIQNNLTTLY